MLLEVLLHLHCRSKLVSTIRNLRPSATAGFQAYQPEVTPPVTIDTITIVPEDEYDPDDPPPVDEDDPPVIVTEDDRIIIITADDDLVDTIEQIETEKEPIITLTPEDPDDPVVAIKIDVPERPQDPPIVITPEDPEMPDAPTIITIVVIYVDPEDTETVVDPPIYIRRQEPDVPYEPDDEIMYSVSIENQIETPVDDTPESEPDETNPYVPEPYYRESDRDDRAGGWGGRR